MSALDASMFLTVGALFAAAVIILAVCVWDGWDAAGLDGERDWE